MSITKEQASEIFYAFIAQYSIYMRDEDTYILHHDYNAPQEFPTLTKQPGKPGDVVLGESGRDHYILFRTKVGNVMLYREGMADPIKWICDEEYAICQSARDAGFTATTGSIQSVKQLQHLFLIPASYK